MKIIVANWKMNNGFDEVDQWIEAFYEVFFKKIEDDNVVEVVLCPPNIMLDYIDTQLIEDGFHFLEYLSEKYGKQPEEFSLEEIKKYVYDSRALKLGAQDCGFENEGQFTGDVSAKQLKEVNCEYIIIGHSERRKYHHETNEIVSKKVALAVKNDITPILCIGEPSEIRQEGKHFEYIKNQIKNSLPFIGYKKLLIAYEPIWAIGTGITATPIEIAEMADFVHNVLKTETSIFIENFYLLYGGSVNSSNSSEILDIKGIDGLLVGKASLNFDEFGKILMNNK